MVQSGKFLDILSNLVVHAILKFKFSPFETFLHRSFYINGGENIWIRKETHIHRQLTICVT
jgi:hypothetical protein